MEGVRGVVCGGFAVGEGSRGTTMGCGCGGCVVEGGVAGGIVGPTVCGMAGVGRGSGWGGYGSWLG